MSEDLSNAALAALSAASLWEFTLSMIGLILAGAGLAWWQLRRRR